MGKKNSQPGHSNSLFGGFFSFQATPNCFFSSVIHLQPLSRRVAFCIFLKCDSYPQHAVRHEVLYLSADVLQICSSHELPIFYLIFVYLLRERLGLFLVIDCVDSYVLDPKSSTLFSLAFTVKR